MRILLLTQIYSDKPVSGGVRIIWNYSQALARLGTKVFVVANVVDTDNLPKHENLKVYKVPFGRYALEPVPEDSLKSFFFSIPLILWHRIDIVHIVPIQSLSPFSRFKFGTKFVQSAERTWDYEGKFKEDLLRDRKSKSAPKFTLFQKIFLRFSRLFYRLFDLNGEFAKGTDAFFCRSRSLFEYLRSEGIKSKLFYIPIGVDTHEFKPGAGLEKRDSKFIFLSSGGVAYRKGTHHLIDAYKEFSKKYPNFSELWLMGNSASSILEELKKRADGETSIKFLGEVAPSQISHYYSLCDVCVSPVLISQYGPVQPNASEAMSSGVPLIISDYGETRMWNEQKIALTFEAGNIDSLSHALEKIFLDKALRIELSNNGRKHIEENFDWQVLAAKGLSYYQELLND